MLPLKTFLRIFHSGKFYKMKKAHFRIIEECLLSLSGTNSYSIGVKLV